MPPNINLQDKNPFPAYWTNIRMKVVYTFIPYLSTKIQKIFKISRDFAQIFDKVFVNLHIFSAYQKAQLAKYQKEAPCVKALLFIWIIWIRQSVRTPNSCRKRPAFAR